MVHALQARIFAHLFGTMIKFYGITLHTFIYIYFKSFLELKLFENK